MKIALALFILFLSLLTSGCIDPPRPTENVTSTLDNCKVSRLQWQVYSRGFDAKEATDLATKLTLAANADAAKLKNIVDASVGVDVSITSELSRLVNQNVKQESKVSEKFWEQELTFRQTLCYLDDLSKRPDLDKNQKSQVVSQILEVTKARQEYTFRSEKKTGQNQQ